MKVLGNLDLRGNQIQGVSAVLDTEGNPIGGGSGASDVSGMSFKLYEDTFDSSDVDATDSGEDANGNSLYFKTITISGSEHGIINPIVQLFEVSSGVSILVNVDVEIDDDDNDITFKFAADDNYDVADWANDTITYKYRIMGVDASSVGSDSGSGD